MTEQLPSMPDWLSSYITSSTLPAQSESQLKVLFSRLVNMSSEEVTLRANEIRRLMRDNGFAEFDDLQNWQLDPLPVLMSNSSWNTLSRGVEQHVRLLNQILADLNGPKTTLTNGVFSAKNLMQHPYYLAESHTDPSLNQGLFMVAFDIAQDIHGEYYVVKHHCQFPRGLGLLLENRIVARRVMSEEFAECGVQRIAGFFEQLQHAISNEITTVNDPRVVILCRGLDDKYYSEQAYLATYLGYTLVHSADLTVRKGQVWLKALEGLRKVDVILRWVEDRFLDPLEQIEYSEYGIPGLLHAVRAQNVALLNPFGNGLIQIPAITNNLDDAAYYFGCEPLLLKQQETCIAESLSANDWAQYELLSHIDPNWKADGGKDAEKITETLSKHNADDYFWRRKINLTHAPFWQENELESKPILMRCYALYSDDQVYMLPSAMCFTPASTQSDGKIVIKDTWVETIGPQPPVAPSKPKARQLDADTALLEGLLPSRTAENLFWLGCAAERTENLVRLVRLYIDKHTELAIYPDESQENALLRLKSGLEQQSLIYPYLPFAEELINDSENDYKSLAVNLIKDDNLAGGLFASVNMIVQNALQVRELLSYDSLRIIESIEEEHHALRAISQLSPIHRLQTTLDRFMGLTMAFNGSILDSLSKSNGSFMLEMGRRLERSKQLVVMVQAMLQHPLPEAEQTHVLDNVLIAQASSVTHRRRYRAYQSLATGMELLLLDSEYPRSLAYQIQKITRLCSRLPTKAKPGFLSTAEKILLQLKACFALVDRHSLLDQKAGSSAGLTALLENVTVHMQTFSEMMQTEYFSHTKPASQLNWDNSRNAEAKSNEVQS